jgi:hypothetical protein
LRMTTSTGALLLPGFILLIPEEMSNSTQVVGCSPG